MEAQVFEYVRPAWVIEASNNLRYFEDLPGNPGRNHIGLITGSHRSKPIGLLNAGLSKHIPIKTYPWYTFSFKSRAQSIESLRVFIDHAYGLTS
jgi:hypothetical protein